MSHTEEDAVPVLNDVVESGNESIIKSSRLGRTVLRELQALQETASVKFVLHEHILQDKEERDSAIAEAQNSAEQMEKLPLESQMDLIIDDSSQLSAQSTVDEDTLELMIDELVDRHITELRKDIRRLLLRVQQNT